MKRLSLAITALSALTAAVPAFAADMALKAAPPAAPPAFSWAGWYAGVNVGGSFGSANESAVATTTGVPLGSTSAHLDGVIGGGQIGYNWQSSTWVFGLEADIQGSSEKASATSSATILAPGVAPVAITGTLANTEKLPWFGTVRARLGFTPSPTWLVYATGGLAYGQIDTDTTSSSGAVSVVNNFSTDRAGWTVGGGVESSLGNNWSAKLEYLYIDFGSFSDTFATIAPFPPLTLTSHVTDNIVRVGVNYRFAP